MGNVVKGSQLVANSTDPNITYMKFKSNMDAILFKHIVDINHVDLVYTLSIFIIYNNVRLFPIFIFRL